MAGKIFDIIVDSGSASGSDFSTIDAGLAASQTVLVKSGTYSSDATITVDQNNTFLKIEPGTTINANTGGLVISANNCQIEVGPGCTIDNNASASALSITISGSDNSIVFKNKCTIGNISITSGGDRTTVDGGGWGNVIESVDSAGDDCIIQYSAWDSKTSTTGLDAISISGSTNGRTQVLFNKVTDSDVRGIEISDVECLALGNIILQADSESMYISGARTRTIGNGIAISDSSVNSATSLGANSVYSANYVNKTFNVIGADTVAVANRCNAIIDSTTTSVVQFNDMGTASCTVTGTWQSGTILESEVVSGGKTLIFTLTNAVFQSLPTADLATAWQALLTSDQSEGAGWDARKSVILADTTVALSSNNTVATLTLAADASYSTTIAEIITCANLDSTVLASESTITPNDVTYNISTGS